MQAVVGRQKGGHGPRHSMRREETAAESVTACVIMYSWLLKSILMKRNPGTTFKLNSDL